MKPTRFTGQDGDAVDALVTDLYLDGLLTAGDRRTQVRDDAADGDDGQPTPDELRRATAVVRASLVRVHPSFRFEERLAARLAQFAAADASQAVAMGGSRGGAVIPFPGGSVTPSVEDPLLQAVVEGELDPSDADAVARADGTRSPAKPLIVGGAITSAAISIVGVALVAWRATRPNGSTMARAAREAHARRLADLAELAAGVHGGPA